MSEELLKELLEETKKQNKIQEEIKREMELQNDLMVFFIEHAQEVVSNYRYSNVGEKLTKGRLYARLSEEDRSILERFSYHQREEVEMYHRVTGGYNYDFMLENNYDYKNIIVDNHNEVINGYYTEEEMYEFFARVFERGGLSKRDLDNEWEKCWQSSKKSLIDDDDDGYEQKFMEMYENRITKNMVK